MSSKDNIISELYAVPSSTMQLIENEYKSGGLVRPLMHHQIQMVHALLQLEEKRTVRLRGVASSARGSNFEPNVKSDSCFLSAPVGSGKTAVILALLSCRKWPKQVTKTGIFYDRGIATPYECRYAGYCLGPSIIWTMPSVFEQWLEEAEKFTTLRVYKLINVASLREFETMCISGEICQYDVIVAKNNYISVDSKLVADQDSSFGDNSLIHRSIMSLVGRIVDYARVFFPWSIYDDYDSSHPPADAAIVPTLYSVFVSSTCRNMSRGRNRSAQAQGHPIGHMMPKKVINMTGAELDAAIKAACRLKFSGAGPDDWSSQYFNVTCDLDYIKKCINVPAPITVVYTLGRKDDWALSAIAGLGPDIALMLNAGANGTAATALGLLEKNVVLGPGSFLKKLLASRYDEYTKIMVTLGRVQAVIAERERGTEERERGTEERERGTEERERGTEERERGTEEREQASRSSKLADNMPPEEYIKKVKAGTASHLSVGNFAALVAEEARLVAQRQSCLQILDRFKANIAEKECPICCNSLTDATILLTRCCTLPLCVPCGDKCRSDTQGRCPQCRAAIAFPSGFIYIGPGVDIAALESAATKTEEPSAVVNDIPASSPKISLIAQIISDKIDKDVPRREVSAAIINREYGFYCKEDLIVKGAATSPKKVLIFSHFDEVWPDISKHLAETCAGARLYKLSGSPAQLADALRSFKAAQAPAVLFIQSMEFCAGLNIQEATDVIFMHHYSEKAIMQQVLGRVLRMGRVFSVRVHMLNYKNEPCLL
jgi:hypothetical protein